MEADLEAMGTRLEAWAVKIDELTGKYTKPGAKVRFDVVMSVDELKGLLAVARAEIDAYRVAGVEERARRAPGMQVAWDELAAAMARRPPYCTPS